jgi:putative ABC transport system permease protein
MAADTTVGIEGRLPARAGEEPVATVRAVMPGYFETMRIPFKEGRDISEADNFVEQPYRFIVNEAFVKRYLTGADPIGIGIGTSMNRDNHFGPIIGIVGDVKEGALDKNPVPTVYYSNSHLPFHTMTIVLRTQGDPSALAESARRIVLAIDPEQPVADVRSMEAILGETFARQRFSALLLAGFSIASLLLAAVGIYGVLAYSVTQRTREIGVRVALGAEPGRIIGLVITAGAHPVLAGAIAGVVGALVLSSLIKGLLFGIGPHDPLSFILAPTLLIVVALFAAYLPARRAARLAPMDALRMD